uniref:Uncharacterized protein n=1 Tax=Steinernema glaseri TaxID=37863 RepID=A0A1I8AJ14_9BILA
MSHSFRGPRSTKSSFQNFSESPEDVLLETAARASLEELSAQTAEMVPHAHRTRPPPHALLHPRRLPYPVSDAAEAFPGNGGTREASSFGGALGAGHRTLSQLSGLEAQQRRNSGVRQQQHDGVLEHCERVGVREA